MKKCNNCNNLFILGISISFILIIGIIMTMNMKENYTAYVPLNGRLSDFKPTIIEQKVDVSLNRYMDMAVMQQSNTNYKLGNNNNNEISLYNKISYDDCFNNCIKKDDCNGIVTNFPQNSTNVTGSCSLRSKMNKDDIYTSNGYYSTIFPR